ncbi:MAG: alpha-amylase family glycosyl hydrolase [Candidatus Thorarchaeota archaeon]
MVTIPETLKSDIIQKSKILYGNRAQSIFDELVTILESYNQLLALNMMKNDFNLEKKKKFDFKDIILNIYADSIQGRYGTPLQKLYSFTEAYIHDIINGVHILPFFPWDTDRGFSVLNYYEVDQRNGSWEDFTSLKNLYDILMIDCVINHASINNPLVQKALIGNLEYQDFVITYKEEEKPTQDELLKITRARPTPVLTRYYVLASKEGKRWVTFNIPLQGIESKKVRIEDTGWVWTTFSRPKSPDGVVMTRQVDLNYSNPKVFLEMVRIILFYISKGARWLRLDAIGYLWKKIGTTCLHQPETHIFISLINDILKIFDYLQIVLIGEVNEPQEKALQYLCSDETDMIYLFTHFPLAVHAILTGTSQYYMKWIPSLKDAKGRLFISVLGTHDGMGMKPIGNWLPDDEKTRLQRILTEEYNALPNYALITGGKKIIYELCSTPWNFINKNNSDESEELQIRRYTAVLALGLMIRGIPSIYINGLLGIPNFTGELDENRSINRQILYENYLNEELNYKNSRIFKIFSQIMFLIKIRKNEEAFDPHGPFIPYYIHDAFVSILLTSSDNIQKIFALVNVTKEDQILKIPLDKIGLDETRFQDIITDQHYEAIKSTKTLEIAFKPYQICWLKQIQ